MSKKKAVSSTGSGVVALVTLGAGACTSAGLKKALGRRGEPARMPSDLVAWLARVPTRRAAQVLGVGEPRVRQLRCGAGASVSPAILRRWAEHRADVGLPVGAWQIRRVMAPGVVWMAGDEFPSPALAGMVGRQVNVARLRDGGLRVLPLAAEGGFDVKPVGS